MKRILKEKIEEFTRIAQLLKSFPDLQCRQLLFRFCFASKATYLFRTVRPDLMVDFAKSFEDLQKNILWSLFGCAREYLDDKYDWMCLKINEGGMGIHKISEMAPAAFTASFITWIQSDSFKEFAIPNQFENHDFDDSPSRIFVQFSKCLQQFQIAPTALDAVQKLRNMKLPFRETLQSYLTNILQNKRIQDMQQNMELKELEWWSNQRNDMSGQPLLAFPSMEPYIIRTPEFRT